MPLLSITELLTLPGEYVTGKNWHLYSVYHVIMYKQFGWIFSYNSFHNRPKKSSKKKWKNSQRCWTMSSLHMSQNVTTPASHILLTHTRSFFATCVNFSHYFAPTLSIFCHFPPSLVIYKLYINFYLQNLVLFLFFSSSGQHRSHDFVGCQATGIKLLLASFFTWFASFKSIMPSHMSAMKSFEDHLHQNWYHQG